MVRYATIGLSAEHNAISRGNQIKTHFKNMREVGAALTGMALPRAFAYLGAVSAHKECIPFRRFCGGTGRTGQATQFGTTKGRWPEKSVKHITALLKNAASNAEAKGLTADNMVIKTIVVNQAIKTRRRTFRAHGRINPYQGSPCHVEVVLAVKAEQVERSKDESKQLQKVRGLNVRQKAAKRTLAIRSA